MTLREIHERCKARHDDPVEAMSRTGLYRFCGCCDESWPCADYSDAVAALAILDEAKLDIFTSRFDRVPASEWVDAVRLVPETRHVSVPDPERPAPTPTTTEEA